MLISTFKVLLIFTLLSLLLTTCKPNPVTQQLQLPPNQLHRIQVFSNMENNFHQAIQQSKQQYRKEQQ